MIALFVGLVLAGDGEELPVAGPAEPLLDLGVSEVDEPVAPVAPPPVRIEQLLAEPVVTPKPRAAPRGLDLDDGMPWALLVVGGLAVGATWWLKFRKPGGAMARSPLSVVERVSVGGKAELLLVDVVAADGERRRLLIGTGGAAPALVADLGGRELELELEEAESEAGLEPVAPERMERIRRFVDTGSTTATPRASAVRAPEPVAAQRSPVRAKSLVDEVLARRRIAR